MPTVAETRLTFGASTNALIEFLTDSLTVLLLNLGEDPDQLERAYEEWQLRTEFHNLTRFKSVVLEVTDGECALCEDCSTISWSDDLNACVGRSSRVCEACFDNYVTCHGCREHVLDENTTYAESNTYCSDCLSDSFTFCDYCDEYHADNNPCAHNCECDAPHPLFKFPANGHGTMAQNERLTVELPKGTIDDQGIKNIHSLLWSQVTRDVCVIEDVLEGVGFMWQTKRGNFTRRLSSALHKHGHKLAPGIVSEIGNLARAHSSDTNSWTIELTRDLNEPAEAFYNEDSCWWQSYSYARCALKNWGGIGLRTYATEDDESYMPNGRAWVQPLDAELQPTHDTESARAYVVYNGYGALEGYAAARIIAHLTSRSYKKITFGADRLYVNNNAGYLVADEETCEATERLRFDDWDEHNKGDAHTYKEVAA